MLPLSRPTPSTFGRSMTASVGESDAESAVVLTVVETRLTHRSVGRNELAGLGLVVVEANDILADAHRNRFLAQGTGQGALNGSKRTQG
ncbi:MAG TPA: hypothetical protein D7I05_01370, partial [Candidatus Poseidoniales archaeon]